MAHRRYYVKATGLTLNAPKLNKHN